MEYVIGVDIGTTNTKAIATDLGGRMLFRIEVPNATITPEPGNYEQDPDVLYEAVKTCIAKVVGDLKDDDPKSKVIAVSFSSAMHGVIALDDAGNPMTNCILWSDSRSADIASKLKVSVLGEQFYANTGTPIHTMSPLCKIAWMAENMADIHARSAMFVSVKEYVFFKLFGAFLVDFSIASATGLFDVHRRQWYVPALDYAGITPAQLSLPVPITHRCVGLRTVDAEAMGLEYDTPFVLGGSDGCLANLGVGAVTKGIAAVTVGTSGAIRVTENVPRVDPEGRVFSYVLTPELHIVGGPVNNGGNVLQWFLDNLYVGAHNGVATSSIESLIDMAESVEPGADGLVFLPYLLGERAPLWDASARGAYFGVRMHHGNAHFARATVEGVVYGLYDVARVLMGHTGPIEVIHATGGFFESSFCVQLLADVFGTPVHVKEDVDGSALGAAVVALHALDYLSSLQDVAEHRDVRICYPNADRHERYARAFAHYARVSTLLKNEF